MTIDDISMWIESRVEGMYNQMTRGGDKGQAQVISIRRQDSQNNSLPWGDHADQLLKDGDTIIVDCRMASGMMRAMMQQLQQPKEEDLKRVRDSLRFDLNDRVVCYCGPRWFSGHVVGSAVPDEGEILPYLVKTDPVSGCPTRTISVPSDNDEICTQEVCFDPLSQLHLVKAAAQEVKGSVRPKLRFGVGDGVVVRIKNSAKDGLEQWVEGRVGSTWPKLDNPLETWEVGGVSGVFPETVPYKVDLGNGGWVYVHRDNFTLIRREGLQPQTRVKGISKRMEVLEAPDGSREKIDYQTERRKRMLKNIEDDDSD